MQILPGLLESTHTILFSPFRVDKPYCVEYEVKEECTSLGKWDRLLGSRDEIFRRGNRKGLEEENTN